MILPNIQIDWDFFKGIDEFYVDDMSGGFGIILLTLVKGDDIHLIAYDVEEKSWGLLQEK